MKVQDWIYMDGYDEVLTADTLDLVFRTDELSCVDANNFSSVVDKVVELHNSGASWIELEEYLLDEALCTSDDKEIILESAYKNYYVKLPLQKL